MEAIEGKMQTFSYDFEYYNAYFPEVSIHLKREAFRLQDLDIRRGEIE